MTIRGVLFDKDGTLLDYSKTWLPINRVVTDTLACGDRRLSDALLASGGHDPETDTVRANCTLAAGSAADLAVLWQPQLRAAGLMASSLDALAAQIDRIFSAEGIRNATPVCDLAPFLRALSDAGLAIGMATSDSESAALATLHHLQVRTHFSFVCGYDSGHGVKPGPGMVQGFCTAAGLHPSEVAMVGDNQHDLSMARAAGAGLAVGVLTGSSDAAALAPLADAVLPDITGLLDLLGVRQ